MNLDFLRFTCMQVPNTEGEDKEDDGPEQDAENRCHKLEKQQLTTNKLI
jgi:hypothetical protein